MSFRSLNFLLVSLFLTQASSIFHIPYLNALPREHKLKVASQGGFNWTSILPSESLEYHACYTGTGLECARLIVPLDWSNTSNPNKLILAIARQPATVPEDHEDFGGTIQINPGGPGGSGVQFIRFVGKVMQDALAPRGFSFPPVEFNSQADDRKGKFFEILSFDPRGVENSLPNADCFTTTFKDQEFNQKRDQVGQADEGERALRMQWAYEQALLGLCSSPEAAGYKDDNLRAHVSTASVARDMLHIAEKVEELKQKIVKKKQAAEGQDLLTSSTATFTDSKKAKLQYLGGSYGTFLGMTFASMFPSRVHRMVLDGNVDAIDFGQRFHRTYLTDTDKVYSYLYTLCFSLGESCALFRSSDTNPDGREIMDRVNAWLEDLKTHPIPYHYADATTGLSTARLITRADIIQGLFITLYQPPRILPIVFSTINALMTQNHTLLSTISARQFGDPLMWQFPLIPPKCPGEDRPWEADLSSAIHMQEATAAIHCADGSFRHDHEIGYDAYLRNADDLIEQSNLFGGNGASFNLPCFMWPRELKDNYAFHGPYGAKLGEAEGDDAEMSTPPLFLSSRLDPVCPLDNAYRMSKLFEGSGLIIQESVGHCATFPMEECVWGKLKEYFDTGAMPEHGHVCHI